jgi:hypothetical protein
MYTHERKHYWDLGSQSQRAEAEQAYRRLEKEQQERIDKTPFLVDGNADPLLPHDLHTYYFVWHFVHPQAWEKALRQFPDLTLCLAHFGADAWEDDWIGGKEWIETTARLAATYPNMYTDISYLFIDDHRGKFKAMLQAHPHMLDKILFGTDWYMIEFEPVNYQAFCVRTKKMLEEIGQELGLDLWTQFSVINPMRYLGLDKKADRIAEALLVGVDKDDKIQRATIEKGRWLLKRYSEAKVKALSARLAAKA